MADRAHPSQPRGPLNSPGFWLHHAALAWRQEVDRRLRPLGLTHTQFDLLASTHWLCRQGEAPTQQEVAELAGVDRMTTSKVLAGLESRSLLSREPHPRDSRAKCLRPSQQGSALVRRAVRIVADIDADLFGTSNARDLFTRRLRDIAERRQR